MRATGRLVLGLALVLAATAGAATEIAIRHRVVTTDVAGTAVPVPLAGRIATTGTGANLDTRIVLAADLGPAQQRILPILRARLDRNNPCGDRIEVRQAALTAVPPAARVTADLSYGRSICVTRNGKRYRTKLVSDSGSLVFDVTPGARNGVITVDVRIVAVKAGGVLGALLRDPKLLQPMAERIANEAVVRIEALVPPAVWRIGPDFRHVGVTSGAGGAIGLEIVAAKWMTPAALDALAAAVNGAS
jgi:hypothetical protein